MKLFEITPEKIEDISDWYWEFGRKRTGIYALKRGGWYDRMNRIISEYNGICHSEKNFLRPAVALWGPSQSGKSTLLASFIDYGEGALSWDDKKFRFVPPSGNAIPYSYLNPNNRGSDASGCVTRYVMRRTVPYPETPVELQFADERDIFMSLAFGYLSEMEGKDRNGRSRHYEADHVRDILDDFRKRSGPNAVVRREYFPRLVAVVDVLDALIFAKQGRYENLEAQKESLRGDILNCDALLTSEEAALEFAAELFWDGWRSLTDTCSQLLCKLEQLKQKIGNKKVYCSLRAASVFLDISAAGSDDADDCLIGEFGFEEFDKKVVLLKKGGGAFSDKHDFALTQALVSVLIVPLKESVIKQSNEALFKLLCKADLVDFPGVANEDKGTLETLLRDDDIRGNKIVALTKVFKRGKTASIVIGYSRNLDIDVFSILMRMNKYPPKPGQLEAGISAWFMSMIQESFSRETGCALPINIVQTFASELINSVAQRAIGKDGLKNIFEKNEKLGTLSDPKCVKYFCINYPDFKPTCDFSVQGVELERLVGEIENDSVFVKYYETTLPSLRAMCGLSGPGGSDGGRTYLFEQLLKQVDGSARKRKLEERKERLNREFDVRVQEALPLECDMAVRRRADIQLIVDRIKASISWRCDQVARSILELSNIPPENLERLPLNLEIQNSALDGYCNRIFDQVRNTISRSRLGVEIQLENEIVRERFVGYLMEGCSSLRLKKWICEKFSGDHMSEDMRWGARRLIALYLSSQLLRSGEDNHQEVSRIFPMESDYRDSPSYNLIIEPFLKTLSKIVETHDTRGTQPGDNELRVVLDM